MPLATASSSGGHRAQCGHPAQPSAQRRGQRRLVELHHHRCARAGEPAPRDARQRLRPATPPGRAAHPGSVIARWPLASSSLGGQRDRPRCLHLDHPAAAAQTGGFPGLFESVHVLVEQADRPAGHRAGPGGEPVAARHRVDGDVDQQRARPGPSMSAPTPRAGSSTMWASASASSPTTTSAACRAAVPGHDPMPLAFRQTDGRKHSPANRIRPRTRPPVSRGLCAAAGSGRFNAEGCRNRVADGEVGAVYCCCARRCCWWRRARAWWAARPLAGSGARRQRRSGRRRRPILLDQSRMRAITGAGEHLTIIPSMDGTVPGRHRRARRDRAARSAGSSTPRPRPSGPTSRSSTRPRFRTRPTAR